MIAECTNEKIQILLFEKKLEPSDMNAIPT